jgi:hypothetical protein
LGLADRIKRLEGREVPCPRCSREPTKYTVNFGPNSGIPGNQGLQPDPDERCPSCGRRLVETYVIGWGETTKAGKRHQEGMVNATMTELPTQFDGGK